MVADELEQWAAGARAREAADSRMRERWLRQQTTEESSLRAVLSGLAAVGRPVVLTTTSGGRHQAQVLGVGDDFVALGRRGGPGFVLVGLPYVATVADTPADSAAMAASSTGMGGLTLVDMLAQACGHRPLVAVLAGPDLVAGELRAVGADIVTLLTDGPAAATVYVLLASVSEVSFLGSG